MHDYLVWAFFGGTAEDPICRQGDYRVIEAADPDEAARKWAEETGRDPEKMFYKNRHWHYGDENIRAFELIKENGFQGWKRLKWIPK